MFTTQYPSPIMLRMKKSYWKIPTNFCGWSCFCHALCKQLRPQQPPSPISVCVSMRVCVCVPVRVCIHASVCVCVCVCVLNTGVSSFFLCLLYICMFKGFSYHCMFHCSYSRQLCMLPLIHLASLSTTFVSVMCLCLIFVSYEVVIHIFSWVFCIL